MDTTDWAGQTMERRSFLRTTAATGLTLAWPRASVVTAQESRSAVAMVENREPGAAAEGAVALLGGFGRFVSRGQKVLVKPNIGWDRTPQQGANTHPDVVRAVVRGCLAAGAREVLVLDRSCNDPRLSYRTSGILAAVEAMADPRVSIQIPDKRKFVPREIPRGVAVTRWSFYEDALTADVVINLPVLKHHSLCGLTMGLKNVMGILGDNRGQLHRDFDDKIVDVNEVVRPRLTVLDASRILLRHGPQGGNLEDVRIANTVLAGEDVVAVDAVGATLFGTEPGTISHLVNASRRGLGKMTAAAIEIRKG
jgi:uncharacterized protein (DUF362 family)